MWEQDPVGVDLKRPLSAFVLVSVLAVFLVVASSGRGDALRSVFHAPRPISAVAPAGAPVGNAVLVEKHAPVIKAAKVPLELTAQPVGQGSKIDSSATLTAAPTSAIPTQEKADKIAAKADRKADRDAAKADRKADRDAAKADRKADRDAAKADRKADRAAAKADRKADRDAAKADRKADRAAAKADRKAAKAASKAERKK